MVAVILWVILSVAFTYYVTNFGNYNRLYGSIGAVIAMLIWLWISSFLVLFGGSLNAQIEIRTLPDAPKDAAPWIKRRAKAFAAGLKSEANPENPT